MGKGKVRVRRVYDDTAADDGDLVLVDRLWPRGVRKSDLGDDAWVKDVAPSRELRTWYQHEPSRFEEFRRRYHAELATGPAGEALDALRDRLAGGHTITLLTATKDVAHSHVTVLAELLRGQD